MSLWFSNLTAYCVQVGLIAGTAVLLCSLARLRAPGIQLYFWQGLLAACLLMPFLQSRQPVAPPAPISAQATVTVEEGEPVPAPGWSPIKIDAALLVLLVLGGGSLWHVLRLAAGLYRLRLLRLSAQPIGVPEGAADLMSHLRTRADFRISPVVQSPVTFGWRRPTILFPPAFAGWDIARRRMIVCHELLHVRRRDWLAILTEELVKIALWFHPAVRWILKRIRLCREQVIDREVVDITGAREAYIMSLIEIAAPQSIAAIPAPLLREHDLMSRISAITQEVSMSKRRATISLIFIIAVLASAVFWSVGAFPLRSETPKVAQDESSRTVQGDVYDPQGRPVAGAMVHVFDGEGLLLARHQTDSAGHFQFNLPKASASLRVLRPGFQIAKLEVESLRQAPVKVVLKLGEVFETVKVRVPPATQAAISTKVPAAVTPKEPVRVGGQVQAQKMITKVDPVYPREAKLQSIEGSVVLQITVSETGNVTDARVISGPEALRGSAVDAVRQWVYEPTYLNGEPVVIIATVTINYALAADLQLTLDSIGNIWERDKQLVGVALSSRIAQASGLIALSADPALPDALVQETLAMIRNAAPGKVVVLRKGDVTESGARREFDKGLQSSGKGALRPGPGTGTGPGPRTGTGPGPRTGTGPGTAGESGGEVHPPRLLHRVNAEYPARAKEAGISGAVVLRIRIDEAGKVSEVSVVSGHAWLRDSAVAAVNQWRYSPTLLNGSPVATEATVTLDFLLQ